MPYYNQAPIALSSSGDSVAIIPGIPGRKVVIYQGLVVAGGAVSLTVKSSGGTALSGAMPIAANGNGLDWRYTGAGYFVSLPGEGIILNLSGSVTLGGFFNYASEV